MNFIECKSIRKYFGDRLILDIPELTVLESDRIGVVGANGSGKTTLLSLLMGSIQPDEGVVRREGSLALAAQMETPSITELDGFLASRFRVPRRWRDTLSGGEKTRFRLAGALGGNPAILLLDEPTCNTDMEGIALLEEILSDWQGGLVLVSHDRWLLDRLCTEILEVEGGRVRRYPGNYSAYEVLKEEEEKKAWSDYRQWSREKRRLEEAALGISRKARSVRKTPSRMGNSEARLHKMHSQKATRGLEAAARRIRSRIGQLGEVSRPSGRQEIRLESSPSGRLHGSVAVEAERLSVRLGEQTLLEEASFLVPSGSRMALMGPNGSGKSTLLKMILSRTPPIWVAPGARIGYFSQELDILNPEKDILENVMETSVHPEEYARMLLARLLFREDSVHRPVGVLSGGEKVKVSFAKILVGDHNLLILDEPTNFMDIGSLKVMEEFLSSYPGTLLFVTHDRAFLEAVATGVLSIESQKIRQYPGVPVPDPHSRLLQDPEDRDALLENRNRLLVLETRLSELSALLGTGKSPEEKERLDREYLELAREVQRLREDQER